MGVNISINYVRKVKHKKINPKQIPLISVKIPQSFISVIPSRNFDTFTEKSARTTVEVSRLPREVKIEIDLIAVKKQVK